RQVKGYLQTVVTDDLVAVIAENHEAAVEARDALRVTWDPGPHVNVDSRSILLDYERRVRQDAGIAGTNIRRVGRALEGAARTHAATYTTDFVEQAPLEPMNCVVSWSGDRCDVFTGTQAQTSTVAGLARALGVPPGNVRVHQQYLGGGFGRRL